LVAIFAGGIAGKLLFAFGLCWGGMRDNFIKKLIPFDLNTILINQLLPEF